MGLRALFYGCIVGLDTAVLCGTFLPKSRIGLQSASPCSYSYSGGGTCDAYIAGITVRVPRAGTILGAYRIGIVAPSADSPTTDRSFNMRRSHDRARYQMSRCFALDDPVLHRQENAKIYRLSAAKWQATSVSGAFGDSAWRCNNSLEGSPAGLPDFIRRCTSRPPKLIRNLRDADGMFSAGKTLTQVGRQRELSERTFHACRKQRAPNMARGGELSRCANYGIPCRPSCAVWTKLDTIRGLAPAAI